MRPSRVLPPVKFWRGGQAEEGSELTPAGNKECLAAQFDDVEFSQRSSRKFEQNA
jgi:hypothetical protein